MTRNCENASTSRPGNSSPRCARITLDSSTKRLLPPRQRRRAARITRGSTRGTLTMAIAFSRPNASLPPSRTMKLSDLLATCGNGCAGIEPDRHQQRPHLRCEELVAPSALRRVALGVAQRCTMPCVASAGITLVVEDARTARRPAHARPRRAPRSRARVDAGCRGRRAASMQSANAHLEELVEVRRDDAQVAQPLEQRHVGALRPASSTRPLNARIARSRFSSAGIAVAPGGMVSPIAPV